MEQEIKENVLTLNGGADGKAQTPSGGKGTEDPTELPAKFKDVDALLQAYNSLQAEFTRRFDAECTKTQDFFTEKQTDN